MKTSIHREGFFRTAFLGLILVPHLSAMAADQYWNPTTTAKGAGSNDWDTAVSAWAPTSSGTATPEHWVNGNDAWFNINGGVNHATVNGVSAGLLFFQDGIFTFWPGTGPLTLTGPMTNMNNTLTFNTDIVLAADHNWHVSGKQTTVNGAITGPYTLKKTGGGSPALVLANTNSAFGGLFVESGNVNAYSGGGVIGGATSTLTMGSPEQNLVAKLSMNPRTDQPETSWDVGSVVASGYGEIAFVSDGTKLNIVPFGALSRENAAVLALRQSAGNFDVRQNVTFANEAQIAANGMLPPWVATPASGDFLAYDGLVKSMTYKTTAPDTWTAMDVVHNTSTRTLEADTAVHAMRASADLTVPAGLTLTNASGGLILIGKAIRGDGVLTAGTNELVVYATASSAIDPQIVANGLTVWGGGTLTVTNITWSGDTWIHQGVLKAALGDDVVLDSRRFDGIGELSKDGPGDLTLLNSTGRIGKLSLSGAGETALRNTRLQTLTSLTAAAPLTVSNSYLGTKGTVTTGTGNSNIPIQIVGSGVSGQSTVLDCGNVGALVGVENGSGNMLLVDGKGVTGGAIVTGISNSGNVGFAVGRGTNSSSNRVVIANGGEVLDYEVDTNRNNGIGVGTGANGNRLEILGGEGFVSRLYKSFPHSIGSGSATGNVAIVDGKGFPGSAVLQVGNGTSLNVGSAGGFGNYACITNGGRLTGGSIIVGVGASGNRLDVVGTGSEIVGNGGDSTFSLGTGIASSNVVYVADGGEIRNVGKWSTCIGGAGNPISGTAIGNRMVIAAGGTFLTPNDSNIGRNKDTGSSAVDNGVLVSGSGATWNFGSKALNVGVEHNGSVAQGNYLVVENGGLVLGGSIKVGAMADAVAGGSATDNHLTIHSGGQVRLTSSATCGTVSGAASSSGNRIAVSKGGILEANTLVVGAANDNTISATDGGVFQFTSTTPTITSLTPGDIAIDDGVVSFRNLTSGNVLGNQTTQLANMQWSGANAFRLNNASTTTGSSQNYVFDPAFGSTNYFRLEMVDGTTAYRGTAGNTLTIGQSLGSGGEMLCSNTTASVQMPFVLNGDLTLFNSTLTLQQAAEINGDVFIDLDALPESGAALVAQDDLALGGTATLHLSGTPVDGQVLITCDGDISGRLTLSGLPGAYTLAYGAEGPGTVSLMHSPTVLIVR